jgi:hypothetical protein
MSLRIHQIKSSGKTFLSLEGTILIINERKRYAKSEVQIPVELISIYENKKFRAKDLIIPILFLPFIAFFGAMSYASLLMIQSVNKLNSTDYINISGFFVSFLVVIIIFLTFLIKFFMKRNTVTFVIAPNNFVIDFWKERKQAKEIDELLEQIENRKTYVEESMTQPLQKSVGFGEQRTMIPQLIGSMVLFSMPALITDNIKLMPLALIPLAYYIYNKINVITKVPKLYRQTLKHYFKEEWDKAIILLKKLQEQFPEYLPCHTLLISIYTRTNRYDEALEVVSELPDQYTDLTNNITTDIWRYKRINQRRKENIPENNND